jgi:hypothetical protein
MLKKITILILAWTTAAIAGGAGQNDTTYGVDYLSSFHARIFSYTPNLYTLDADSSELWQSINDALLEVWKFAGATERKDTIAMDSSLWYALASDFGEVARVAYIDPAGAGEIGLDSIGFNDLGKNTTVGTDHPKYYTIWSREIYFDRNNYLEDTMFVYYNSYPAKITGDSTISNVSKAFHNIVVDQAILFFYSGRVGASVPQITAEAKERLAFEYAKMGIKYESITPEVR